MAVQSFESLDVYQRAYKMALVLHKETGAFPGGGQDDVATRIRRDSKAICVQVAAAYLKQKSAPQDFKPLLHDAGEACVALKVYINFCRDLGYVSVPAHDAWIVEYAEIARLVSDLEQKWMMRKL